MSSANSHDKLFGKQFLSGRKATASNIAVPLQDINEFCALLLDKNDFRSDDEKFLDFIG